MTLEQLVDLRLNKRPPATVINSAPTPEFDDQAERNSANIAEWVLQACPTERDVYWFVIEEYDRIRFRSMGFDESGVRVHPADTKWAVLIAQNYPLHEIEYKGMRSEESYVGRPNPGVVFLDEQIMPSLRETYDEMSCNRIRAFVYVKLRELWLRDIERLRIKYAQHYKENCEKSNSPTGAFLWRKVIEELT